MPVKAADPDATELSEAFSEAMGAAPKPAEPPPPPERDPEAPHGRGEDGEPLAPFGWTKADKGRPARPRLTGAGRKSRDDEARTAPAAPAAPAAAAPPLAKDYSGALAETADGAWLCLSAGAAVGPKLPLVGRLIPERKLAAQAYVIHQSRPRLIAAISLAAQHSAKAARWCERLETGNATWVMSFAALAMPVIAASAAIWQGDDELKKREMLSLGEMAKRNETAMDEFMGDIAGQLAAAQEELAAAGEGTDDVVR